MISDPEVELEELSLQEALEAHALSGRPFIWGEIAENATRITASSLLNWRCKLHFGCINAFGVDYPQAERVLLSFAPEPLLIDGIRCEPLEPWLRQLQPNNLNLPRP